MLNKAQRIWPTTAQGRSPATRVSWQALRELVSAQAPLLSAAPPGVPGLCAPGLCAVCHGPSGRRSARCFQCDLHEECAQGNLADIVVPVAFATKGSPHARHLWQYKSLRLRADQDGAAAAAAVSLLALLLVFLHDHGACVWRAAGITGPTHLAVVPTARGRLGAHPLRALIAPYLLLPWADLSALPGGQQVRDLDPERFSAAPLPGARVLLVDDTWTTGASAQSAAMALRRAGANSVATVVLGRHVGRTAAGLGAFSPAMMPFRAQSCAVHRGREADG